MPPGAHTEAVGMLKRSERVVLVVVNVNDFGVTPRTIAKEPNLVSIVEVEIFIGKFEALDREARVVPFVIGQVQIA